MSSLLGLVDPLFGVNGIVPLIVLIKMLVE
jgi:hypothetical protein